MAFQGTFWHWDMLLTGIDWKYFNWHQMEFHDNLNLLKTGVVFADSINTVSPRYAQEIQTHPLGCGLEGVLSHRSDVLTGIVNGVDYSIWNPALDHHLPKKFGPDDWEHGKRACKLALQQEMTLPENPDVPVVGIVGRLTDQKGFDLVSKVMMQWAHSREVQWVILGTGQPKYHEMLQQLASEFPQKVAVRLEFSDPLAHRIEAGADMFLMPSRFEPCGLNQMYSLKYGTVPIVRTTGGLADTVTDTTADSLTAGTATGFRFGDYSELALEEALARACEIYTKRRDTWNQIVVTGMCQDWSWERSARQYGALYEQTTSRRRQALVGE